jgi:hypothetical protein
MPVLENGFSPILHAALYILMGMFDVWIILLFHHQISSRVNIWRIVAIAIIFVGLTIAPLISSVAIFGPDEAAKLRNPGFEQWRILQLGKFLQHVDLLSVLQQSSAAFARCAFQLFLMCEVMEVRGPTDRKYVIAGFCILALFVVGYNWTDLQVSFYLKYLLLPVIAIFAVALVLFLGGGIMIKRWKDRHNQRKGEGGLSDESVKKRRAWKNNTDPSI